MDIPGSYYGQQEQGQQDIHKAGLLNRVIAKTVDIIIVLALQELIPGIGFFAGVAYLLIADGFFQGRSPGKRLVGLKVIIDAEGRHEYCRFRESMIRNAPLAVGYTLYTIFSAIPAIGWLLAWVCVLAVIAFESLVIFGSEQGIRLGDELANTRVTEDSEGGLNV